MESHKVDIADFDNFEFTKEVASSFGNGESKRMVIITRVKTLSARVKVTDHGDIEYDGSDLLAAIEIYNEL